jgi:type II secretory pathway component PulJ
MEVMVSIAIMALITTVAFSGLNIGIDSWTRGSRRIDRMDRQITLERLLKRQLAVAHPTEFRAGENSFVFFRGNATSLEFISDYSLADGAADFRKIGYLLEDGQFRYQEKKLPGYVPEQDERIEGETVAAFSNAGFGFLRRSLQGELEWAGEWKLGDGLPPAVRVQIDDATFVITLVNRR